MDTIVLTVLYLAVRDKFCKSSQGRRIVKRIFESVTDFFGVCLAIVALIFADWSGDLG